MPQLNSNLYIGRMHHSKIGFAKKTTPLSKKIACISISIDTQILFFLSIQRIIYSQRVYDDLIFC